MTQRTHDGDHLPACRNKEGGEDDLYEYGDDEKIISSDWNQT